MTSRLRVSIIFCAAILLLTSGAFAKGPDTPGDGVKLTEHAGKVRVEINGDLFTEYFYEGAYRPYLYPVIGPTGDSVVRNYPMKEGVEGETPDHPHHRSLWFTHGSINGVNFWGNPPSPEEAKKRAESKKAGAGARLIPGQVVHEKLLEVTSGKDKGVIKASNKYETMDGKVILTDTRAMTFHINPDNTRMIDFEVTLHASNGEVTLDDTKEGSMAIRLAATMRLKGPVAQGHIINSEGVKDADTWGKRATWVDYYGPVNGKTVGVACFDHPSNPKHPTWWHVRDYGLFAANPFGVHDFEGKKDEPTLGDIVIPAGKDLTFRWRWYFHTGDEKEGKVAERFAEYAKTK